MMIKRSLIIFFLAYGGLFFNDVSAKAVTYYVSIAGSDANPGTEASPWRTLQKAASAVNAGDIVYVRAGIYRETVSIDRSGTALSPIVFSSYPDERAVIDGNHTLPGERYSSLVSLNGSYIIFQNFAVKNSNGRGIRLGGSYNTASGNNVHHIWDNGIYIDGDHATVSNNRVWRAAESNYDRAHGDWSAGIAWGAAHSPDKGLNTTIRDNRVYQNSGEGVLCMYTKDGLVEGNTVYDNWAMNVYIDQCSNITIQKNLIYYTENKHFWREASAPKGGITLANEGIQDYPLGQGRKILNNILVANGTNIGFWIGKVPGAALVDDLIAHNTLVNAYTRSIDIDAGHHLQTEIVNNLIFQTRGRSAKIGGSGIAISHNLWYPLDGVAGAGDIRRNPRLLDPNAAIGAGRVNPVCYTLKDARSPAIAAGAALLQVTGDFFGANRSTPADIGAHEFAESDNSAWNWSICHNIKK